MLIVISPTKTMKYKESTYEGRTPLYIEESKKIRKILKECTHEDFQRYIGSQHEKARLLYVKEHQKGCALFYYVGLQFKNIEVASLEEEQLTYLKDHLCILSGVYGYLRADDVIEPYRLELQTKIKIEEELLAKYWKNKLDFSKERILNLSSKEYSVVLPDNVVNVHFRQRNNGVLYNKATMAKMYRGKMVRMLALEGIIEITEVKKITIDQYKYEDSLSDENNYYFVEEIL